MKKLFLTTIFLLLPFIFVCPAYAARKRMPKVRSRGTVGTVSQGVRARVRFRPDRQALLINFSNFDNLQSGSYELTYSSEDIPQGAGGSIILGDTDTKTLLFGTCSAGVCVYHTNITQARLKIISILKSGLKVIKPYRIRV